jgi:hypothetical protein
MGSYCIDGNPARRALISSQPMIVGPLKRRPSDEEQMGEWLTPQQWGDYLAGGDVATLGVAMAVHAGILAISN